MNKEGDIVEYIKKIYNPVAIVLTGSRVSGKLSSNSDWDMHVFTNHEFKFGFDEFEGETLDVSPVKYPVSPDFILDTKYHPEQHIRIIYDTSNGWVEEIVKRTNEKYQKGPSQIPNQEYQRLRKIMRRYIQKSDDRKEIEGLAFYYLAIFYEIALRLWFQTRNEWPLPPYEALPHIKENDPEFYQLLHTIYSSKEVDDQVAAAEKIYQKIFAI